MPISKPKLVDSLGDVLLDVSSLKGWKRHELASRLELSTKTLNRYLFEAVMPPASRRHGLLHALSDLPAPLLTRLAAVLGLSPDVVASLPKPSRSLDAARPVIEAVVEDMANRVDAGPKKTRAALAAFVTRLLETDVDLKTALTILGSTTRT
jgi:transcriptional regulator with XRE-family HTH domain